VSESLSKQLTASTEHIQNFVTNNKEFFDTFDKMKEVLATMVQYTQVQADCYKDLKGEILNLRKDYKDAQQESIELHKATLRAVDAMTKAIKDINEK
jgi:peptidoglycan hydrolase CwlO-like protein